MAPHPLQRLAAAHEACRAVIDGRPLSALLTDLAGALRPIFQAEVVVVRAGEPCALEGVSPLGAILTVSPAAPEAPSSDVRGTVRSRVVEPDAHASAEGVERIVVVPVSAAPPATLLFGYGKKPVTKIEDLIAFDLLGDYLAVALAEVLGPRMSSNGASVDDLVSQAAHDLRTPLTPISMLLQTLERKAIAGNVDIDSIGRARRQVQRLTDMVADLIDLARLREGRLLLEPAVMDLRDAFTRAASTFRERDRRRPVELVLGDEPLWIIGDSDRTVHALASLLDHVARISQGDAPVRVQLERQCDNASLQIHGERSLPSAGLRLEPSGPTFTTVHRVPPLGLGVRLADALFTRLGGELRVAANRDGSSHIDGTFPLAPPPSGERSTA